MISTVSQNFGYPVYLLESGIGILEIRWDFSCTFFWLLLYTVFFCFCCFNFLYFFLFLLHGFFCFILYFCCLSRSFWETHKVRHSDFQDLHVAPSNIRNFLENRLVVPTGYFLIQLPAEPSSYLSSRIFFGSDTRLWVARTYLFRRRPIFRLIIAAWY